MDLLVPRVAGIAPAAVLAAEVAVATQEVAAASEVAVQAGSGLFAKAIESTGYCLKNR